MVGRVPVPVALGTPVEVSVSALGDATDILGGTVVWGQLTCPTDDGLLVAVDGPIVPSPDVEGQRTCGTVTGFVGALPNKLFVATRPAPSTRPEQQGGR